MRRLAKKIAENPEIKKGVEKDVDENLNALGRSLQTIDTSTIGALVGGALLGIGYLNSQEEGKKRETLVKRVGIGVFKKNTSMIFLWLFFL